MKLNVYLTLFILLTSCGSILKRDNYVLIDSSPRGMKVYNYDKDYLGVTPFIAPSLEKRKTIYFLEDKKEEFIYRCPLDWQNSLLPAVLLSPFAFPIGVAASSVSLISDYSFDNMFHCKSSLVITSNIPHQEFKRNSSVLILPIHNQENQYDTNEIFNKIKKIINSKYKIIDYNDSLIQFSLSGINEERSWNLKNAKRESLLKVAHKFDATHILIFDKSEFIIYDLFTLKNVTNTIKLEIPIQKEHESNWLTYTKKVFQLIPNSITFGENNNRPVFKNYVFSKDYSYQRHPNQFHWIISSWSIQNISNPKLFETWDYDFKVSPNFSAPSFQLNIDNKNYNFLSYLVTIDAGLTAHTGIGAIGFKIGIGAEYMSLERSSGKSLDSGLVGILHFGLDYVAFLSERFFFQLSIDGYSPMKKNTLENDIIIDSNTSTSLNIGYYFPEVKYFIR